MMLKKLLSVLLTALIIVSLCAIPVSAVSTSFGGFDYQTVNYSEARILGITQGGILQSETVVTIPSSLNAKLVTSIGTSALRDNSTVQQYILPATLEEIGNSAFYNSTGLKTINIPASVTEIDILAFAHCTSLQTITFKEGKLAYIPNYMFTGCTSLDKVILPSTIGSIGEYAFMDCTSLKQLYVPASISRISSTAFKNCTQLTIYGVSGSSAQAFAKANNIPFIALDGVDKSTLNAYLSATEYILEESNQYDTQGVKNLQKVYNESVQLRDDFFATQKQIETTIANIQSAVDALKLKSLVTLENSVANVKEILKQESIYTASSVSKLKTALNTAQELISANSKDAYAVTNANNNLNNAVNALCLKSYDTLQAKISECNAVINNKSYMYTLDSLAVLTTAIQQAENVLATASQSNSKLVAEINNLIDKKNNLVKVLKGDLNEDRKVSPEDVMMVQRYCVKLIKLDTRQQYVADYNNDGNIGLKDNILIQRCVLGIL